MKVVGFIGACEKTDLLLNIAKVLTTMNNKVLIIDSTIIQKARYVVPTITPAMAYITSFEDIDVAVGFQDYISIERYLGTTSEAPYDIMLVDCDMAEKIQGFGLERADKNFFVTSFDLYSLRRGIEILANIAQPIQLTKIVFTEEVLREDEEYLDYISQGYNVVWDSEKIYFPLEITDYEAIIENQRTHRIRLRKISTQYKNSISYVIQQILGQDREPEIRKTIRLIEKEN